MPRFATTLAAFCAASFAAATPAFAINPGACPLDLEITPALVEAAGEFGYDYIAPQGAAPGLLIGGLSHMSAAENFPDIEHGSIAFVETSDGAWRALQFAPGETMVALYQSDDAQIAFSMIQSEGPGQSWTITKSGDGFETAHCSELNFPAALNEPFWANEYLELYDFDFNDIGRGELIASASIEREGQVQEWFFKYDTRDAAISWGAPQRIDALREAEGGLLTPAEQTPAPEELIARLNAFAALSD